MTFGNAALKTFTKSTQCMALLTTHHFPESTLFLRITYRTQTMHYGQISKKNAEVPVSAMMDFETARKTLCETTSRKPKIREVSLFESHL